MPAIDTPQVAARRQRLRDWITEHHGADEGAQVAFLDEFARLRNAKQLPTKLAQSELTGLLKANGKSFGEKKARDIETTIGMPDHYLLLPLVSARKTTKLRITDGDLSDAGGHANAAWLAYIKAPPATIAAVDLLLLPPRERKALQKRDTLVHHCMVTLEQHATEVLRALKSA